MIHIPTRLSPKKTRSRKPDASAAEIHRLVHEIVNHLTVMNLCCFKFRAAAEARVPSSLADIDRMENAVAEIAALLDNIAKAKTLKPLDGVADTRQAEPPQAQSQPSNVYLLFKPTLLQR